MVSRNWKFELHFHLTVSAVAAGIAVFNCGANATAQTGQSNLTTGSNVNGAQASANANGNSPFRVSFGTIARQGETNSPTGTIPNRQPIATNGGGLALPNSPYRNSLTINPTTNQSNLQNGPVGINLQNGSTTQLGGQSPNPGTNRPRSNLTLQTGTNPANSNSPNNSLPNPQSQNQLPNQSQQQPPFPQTQPINPNQTNVQPFSGTLATGTQTSNNGVASNTPDNQSQFSEPTNRPGQRRSITRVTKSMNQLPNDAGQIWREYDITPYTSRITGITDPQQAILDWVLKETGTEMWFNQPLGILNADKNQLRVYHTPEIQERVHRIVDRFVNTRGQVQNVEVSLITVGKPNWRSTAYPMLQPIEVQSPGVEAWMITKENAAILRSALARRGDFKDHGTGRIGQNDGQTVVLRNTKPVQFIRNFRWTGSQFPPYQPLITTIDEGYTMEISSLSSLDGNTIEASIECHVDQVERLNTVKVEVPGPVGATTDRVSLQIPQLVSWRLKERFRWRNDQVLLLSCGVVATPGPQTSLPSALPNLLGGKRQRADALLFVDYRGPEMADRVPGNTARSRTIPVNPRR